MLYYWRVLFSQLNISQRLIPPFFVVVTLSLLVVFCQKSILFLIVSRMNLNPKTVKFLTTAFLR
jgi:hypothetical protein